MEERIILHCDCNSFFASVECRLHPELQGHPVAVCGSEANRHGIVLAKNEIAKGYGIQTAETVWSAKKKCPDLLTVPPHYDAYLRVSRAVNAIYRRYTDKIEPFGIDEAWLDVTGSRLLFGDGKTIADAILHAVREEIGITVSIGVSFNKVFAKMGSDYRKPNAVTVISRENFKELLYPLPVGNLLFCGNRTTEILKNERIETIGALATADPRIISLRLGKNGEQLQRYARGEDDAPVVSAEDAPDQKSIGNGMTFQRDITTEEDIRLALSFLTEEIGERLRRKGKKCMTVGIVIKDTSLVQISRQKTLEHPTQVAKEIADHAFALLKGNWRIGAPIRMLTVSVSHLNDGAHGVQLGFFDEEKEDTYERQLQKENLVDRIRKRHGADAITRGSVLENDLGITRGARKKKE